MFILDEPTVTISVEDIGATLQAFGGERLADLFSLPTGGGEATPRSAATKLSFFMCCRKALCGTCLVEVLEGLSNLSPPTEDELDTLRRLFIENPRARLACQARVWGDVRLKTFSYAT